MKYLVVIDGAGEHDSDYSVVVVEAQTCRDAIERVITPEMGYGRDDDGLAFIAPMDSVATYRINDSRRRTADNIRFEKFVAELPENVRQYIDPDGGHGAS